MIEEPVSPIQWGMNRVHASVPPPLSGSSPCLPVTHQLQSPDFQKALPTTMKGEAISRNSRRVCGTV